MEVLVKQMMVSESVTEELKGTNQMEWIATMSDVLNRAMGGVLNEIAYK